MRRIIAALALGLLVVGCVDAIPPRSVPLLTDAEMSDDLCCLLTFVVMDVEADPTFGTLNKSTDEPLTWPRGYTGRWAGSQVEVLDTTGKVVLTTGGRYWLSPLHDGSFRKFVIGMVKPCPDCELGGGPL